MKNEKIEIPEQDFELLCRGLLTLTTVEDCKNFLMDLCTPSEINEMASRLKTAKMLCDRRAYGDIAAETGLSSATISRVNRAMRFGSGGYEHVLDMMRRKEKRYEF